MLKETEETKGFLVTFLSLLAFQLGGSGYVGTSLCWESNIYSTTASEKTPREQLLKNRE